EAEDRREVRASGAREAEPVLLRAGMGALVRPDAARAVVLDPDAREEAGAVESLAGGAELLAHDPDRRLALFDQHTLLQPRLEQMLGVGVRILTLDRARQVDLDDVERALSDELVPHLIVDDVVRGSDEVLQRPRRTRVIADRVQRLNLGHGA